MYVTVECSGIFNGHTIVIIIFSNVSGDGNLHIPVTGVDRNAGGFHRLQ